MTSKTAVFAAGLAWMACAVFALGWATTPLACATTLHPKVLAKVAAATFEVVAAKPTHDPLTYAKPLPLDLVPYQQRTDKYHPVGTAFAIGPNRYVTAGHVLLTDRNSLWGPIELRDAKGHVYAIDKIEKFALRRDFVVFSLKHPPQHAAFLAIDTHPALNQTVYAVGNALGSGVVTRAGTYTSNTPEQQDGAWQWLRFSAPASPGDSGGPLLDADGRVIGVVLGSSFGGNLNYALPIRQVLDAPAHLARYDHRIAYHFPLFDSSNNVTFKGQFALPLSPAAFNAAFLKRDYAWEDRQQQALLAQQAGRMFPDGSGSDKLLHATAGLVTTPWLYRRNGQGIWWSVASRADNEQLPDNGYLSRRFSAGSILFHLRAPDNVPVATLRDHPQAMMDLMLKADSMRRYIGGTGVRITSLGKPSMVKPFVDRWQRHWQVMLWPIAYDNDVRIVLAMSTPDGDVGMLRRTSTRDEHSNIVTLEAMTGFFNVAYAGSVAQWRAFLGKSDGLPPALQHVRLDVDAGKPFGYTSPRADFAVPVTVLKITPDSRLTLGCNYSRRNGKVDMGVSVIRLVAQRDYANAIRIVRRLRPTADLDHRYQVAWNKIANAQYPWNRVAYNVKGLTRISGVKLTADKAADVRYGVFYTHVGAQSQPVMQTELDTLLHNLDVHEADLREAAAH